MIFFLFELLFTFSLIETNRKCLFVHLFWNRILFLFSGSHLTWHMSVIMFVILRKWVNVYIEYILGYHGNCLSPSNPKGRGRQCWFLIYSIHQKCSFWKFSAEEQKKSQVLIWYLASRYWFKHDVLKKKCLVSKNQSILINSTVILYRTIFKAHISSVYTLSKKNTCAIIRLSVVSGS